MKLALVQFHKPQYDVRTEKSVAYGGGCDAFTESDDYEIRLADGIVSISHPASPGLVALFPFESVQYALAAAPPAEPALFVSAHETTHADLAQRQAERKEWAEAGGPAPEQEDDMAKKSKGGKGKGKGC